MKRLLSVILSACLIAACLPGYVSLAASEEFVADTLTVTGLAPGGGRFMPQYVEDKAIFFTGSEYTFESDAAYDNFVDGTNGIIFVMYNSGIDDGIVFMAQRYDEADIAVSKDSSSITIIEGAVNGLLARTSYDYSLDGLLWHRFDSTILGQYNIAVDTSVDTTVWLRRAANNTAGTPASYPIELVSKAKVTEVEDEEDDIELRLDFDTLKFTGLGPGMWVFAPSKRGLAFDISYVFDPDSETLSKVEIDDDQYDNLFDPGASDYYGQTVNLTVKNSSGATIYRVALQPRPATPIAEFDADTWTVSDLMPETAYQYSPPDLFDENLWITEETDEDGSFKINLKDRSSDYDVMLRLPYGEAYPPSYATPMSVSRYKLTSHVLTVDLDDEFIEGFNEDIKYEFLTSAAIAKAKAAGKEPKWSGLSLTKRDRDSEKDVVKLSKFIPKTGTLTVQFREKAGKGESPKAPFDTLTIAARPIPDTKDKKLVPMYSYIISDEEDEVVVYSSGDSAKVKYATDLMQFAEKPDRGEPYDWEDDLHEEEFGLPDKAMKIFIRVMPLEDEDNLVYGILDVFTPASKMRSVTIRAQSKAPNLKFTVKKGETTLAIKKDHEYKINSGAFVKVGEPKGIILDIDEMNPGDIIMVKKSVTEKAPASLIKTLTVP